MRILPWPSAHSMCICVTLNVQCYDTTQFKFEKKHKYQNHNQSRTCVDLTATNLFGATWAASPINRLALGVCPLLPAHATGRSLARWEPCAPQISSAQPWQSFALFATFSSCAVSCVYADQLSGVSVICSNHVPKLRPSKQLRCKDASSMTSSQPLSDPSLLRPF